ncbi:MAG: HAD-IB family phosphatase [Candidatus Kariarchaeaceae archaeon]|jgi:HAD superfamily phosphoserine phosphatase-like hydrolase
MDSPKTIVLSDFDGTVVLQDTGELILEYFAEGDWQQYDDQLEAGRINLAQCMVKQFRLVRAPKREIIERISEEISYRPHFKNLVEYCSTHSIPLKIVSAGFDFMIDHLLKIFDWSKNDTIAAQTQFTDDGITLSFPKRKVVEAQDFKEDLVLYYQSLGYSVIFIGDGLSDLNAIRVSNRSFIVKGSKLAQICATENINQQEFSDFLDIVVTL